MKLLGGTCRRNDARGVTRAGDLSTEDAPPPALLEATEAVAASPPGVVRTVGKGGLIESASADISGKFDEPAVAGAVKDKPPPLAADASLAVRTVKSR